MGRADPLAHTEGHFHGVPHPHHADELAALREENKQLRELVIELSKIVLKNVLNAG
jgi:hypothetical protein